MTTTNQETGSLPIPGSSAAIFSIHITGPIPPLQDALKDGCRVQHTFTQVSNTGIDMMKGDGGEGQPQNVIVFRYPGPLYRYAAMVTFVMNYNSGDKYRYRFIGAYKFLYEQPNHSNYDKCLGVTISPDGLILQVYIDNVAEIDMLGPTRLCLIVQQHDPSGSSGIPLWADSSNIGIIDPGMQTDQGFHGGQPS